MPLTGARTPTDAARVQGWTDHAATDMPVGPPGQVSARGPPLPVACPVLDLRPRRRVPGLGWLWTWQTRSGRHGHGWRSSWSANLRARAVETFVNRLSEIRRYRQGIIVAEQIPSKLAPDAIKNTNLKIVHRLLAQDDRAALGAAVNMTEAQARQLTDRLRGAITRGALDARIAGYLWR